MKRRCSGFGAGGFLDGGLLRGGAGALADSFDAGSEAGLVARGGVFVEDALLHALVESGDGLAVAVAGLFDVSGSDGFTESAERAADAGAIGAIDERFAFGLTGALERRNVVCHEVKLLFEMRWMRAEEE